MRMVVIAAMDKNNAIGKDNTIPWKVPEDLQRFKELTMGHPMIMGSNTWRSFGGRALPGRPSIVVTSNPESIEIREKDADRVSIVANLEVAIEKAKSLAELADQNQYFVIGGANIYSQVIERADVFDITTIQTEIEEPDTFFPRDKLDALLAEGAFGLDEYHSTLGYEIVSETGLKFEIRHFRRM